VCTTADAGFGKWVHKNICGSLPVSSMETLVGPAGKDLSDEVPHKLVISKLQYNNAFKK